MLVILFFLQKIYVSTAGFVPLVPLKKVNIVMHAGDITFHTKRRISKFKNVECH